MFLKRFCLYPIELVLQFSKKIRLKKVQILSHQYLIATKIEFFIGDCALSSGRKHQPQPTTTTVDEEGNEVEGIEISEQDELSYEKAKYTRLG
jgi:hypothetical protein